MGFGVVDVRKHTVVHVGHGVVRPALDVPLEQRLRDIFLELGRAFALYQPTSVAVEGVFTCRNARSALILGHARGIALLVAAQHGLAVHEYSPAQVKRAVGAGGTGGKGAVAQMVARLLKLPPDCFPRSDASDALAVALCHAHRSGPAVTSFTTGAKASRSGKKASTSFADRLAPSYRRFEA